MSITDIPTKLDNVDWFEDIPADYTTGVLATLSACVEEVESKLKRGTLSASTTPTLTQVQNWLKRAKMELVEVKGFTFSHKSATGELLAGYWFCNLPEDYNGGEIAVLDVANHRKIDVWTASWFDLKYPTPWSEPRGKIKVACVKDMKLWFVPRPSEDETIMINYDRSGSESTADDFSWLPEIERFRCCDFALGEAFGSLHMWEQAQFFMGRWKADMANAMKSDSKRKWHGKRYQAINVFQEFVAKNFQS